MNRPGLAQTLVLRVCDFTEGTGWNERRKPVRAIRESPLHRKHRDGCDSRAVPRTRFLGALYTPASAS
ncbi:MAG TPA: hypothetical protein VNG91_06120, partial [Terriglobia bacterium]|nr:hypothetical protein [Terriglobia bacterium]